jgi:hypothetical protein
LTERELSAYQASAWKPGKTGQEMDPNKIKTAGPRLIVLMAVDNAGNRILNETHVAKLQDWDSADIEFLHKQCNQHIGIGSGVEELEKN